MAQFAILKDVTGERCAVRWEDVDCIKEATATEGERKGLPVTIIITKGNHMLFVADGLEATIHALEHA